MFFNNTLVIHGGSEKLREDCFRVLREGNKWSNLGESSDLRHPHELSVRATTTWQPLDNVVLELAIKYLALDFELIFEATSKPYDSWEGTIYITDGTVEIEDNKQFHDRTELGSIYELKAKGGFPICLQ
jgi:hypothetical protein